MNTDLGGDWSWEKERFMNTVALIADMAYEIRNEHTRPSVLFKPAISLDLARLTAGGLAEEYRPNYWRATEAGMRAIGLTAKQIKKAMTP